MFVGFLPQGSRELLIVSPGLIVWTGSNLAEENSAQSTLIQRHKGLYMTNSTAV